MSLMLILKILVSFVQAWLIAYVARSENRSRLFWSSFTFLLSLLIVTNINITGIYTVEFLIFCLGAFTISYIIIFIANIFQ